ncbi:DUF488 domain-containing protein [Pseudomonas citronellolis]|uniref:DUF488 domain-containing protein n=1 Tax=Pseudomonas citronellolis TaxID=53408 RepID=UPI0023E4504A|nr:DUF488 domain-containing protein [Pseudomonas citronellolis]MDF3931777.1 DUF488 domain-containing protein [Pseudomonas citronellolis]
MIRYKRAYEAPAPDDGYRVLVDRLWPRGIRKEDLRMDEWLKDASPSNELRQRFHHDPTQFEAFRQAYHAELAAHPEHWWKLLGIAGQGHLTLLYGAKDTEHNNARVLAEFLEDELERVEPGSSPVCYAERKE